MSELVVQELEGGYDIMVLHKLGYVSIGLLEPFPLALPHGHDFVAQLLNGLETFHSGSVDVIHSLAVVLTVRFLAFGEASVAPVPKAPQEHVGSLRGGVEPVYMPGGAWDLVLVRVTGMLDAFPVHLVVLLLFVGRQIGLDTIFFFMATIAQQFVQQPLNMSQQTSQQA